MDAHEKAIRQRLKDDLPHYATKCLKIRTKSGKIEPFLLNTAQRYLHERIEQQLRATGRVRAIVIKGRQQGCTTYVEGRYFHKVSHRFGLRAFILSHDDDSARSIFEMAKRYHEHCPSLVKPSTRASNAKELIFDKLDSGYAVATAGSKGAGRSKTLQLFHGSEVAYWPNADSHIAGALQAVPNDPGTEVILESTSAGPHGKFYELCVDAQAGRGDYELIFIPWFWQEEYRREVPDGFELSSEEQDYANRYGLDYEQVCWMRAKTIELGGVGSFRREYPSDVNEAFSADVAGALWSRDTIKEFRVYDHPDLTEIVIAVDPAATSNAESDESGIIAAGIANVGGKTHGYLLSDESCRKDPHGWASQAVAAYNRFRADRIIGEKNNGGEMVEYTILTIPNENGKRIPVKLVWASRGKETRFGPVASLYQEGRIHHVGEFAALEDEMCTWVPGKSTWSPNRADATCWAFTDLFRLEDQPNPSSKTHTPTRDIGSSIRGAF